MESNRITGTYKNFKDQQQLAGMPITLLECTNIS
jgi:hypothetical protein